MFRHAGPIDAQLGLTQLGDLAIVATERRKAHHAGSDDPVWFIVGWRNSLGHSYGATPRGCTCFKISSRKSSAVLMTGAMV